MKKDVTIVGAGLSGMTAGIILAKEGCKVNILDAEKKIGGSPKLHPSVHTTPCQLEELIDYVGFDLNEGFIKCDPYPRFYYKKKLLKFPPYVNHNTAYSVERGPRPTSIDNHLFRIAVDAGVKFDFGKRMKFEDLKPGTIVATGLNPIAYEKLGIEYRKIYGYWSSREIEAKNASAEVFMGPFTNDYGYTSQVNGLDYSLLFSHREITKKDLADYLNMLDVVGIESYPEPWIKEEMGIPAEPKLFLNDLILAGTLSGMIEPFWGYGIVGAIISGGIAAKTVIDPEAGAADYNRFTRGFTKKMARRDKFSNQSDFMRGFLTKAGLYYARLQCVFNKKLANTSREPLRWFR